LGLLIQAVSTCSLPLLGLKINARVIIQDGVMVVGGTAGDDTPACSGDGDGDGPLITATVFAVLFGLVAAVEAGYIVKLRRERGPSLGKASKKSLEGYTPGIIQDMRSHDGGTVRQADFREALRNFRSDDGEAAKLPPRTHVRPAAGVTAGGAHRVMGHSHPTGHPTGHLKATHKTKPTQFSQL